MKKLVDNKKVYKIRNKKSFIFNLMFEFDSLLNIQ